MVDLGPPVGCSSTEKCAFSGRGQFRLPVFRLWNIANVSWLQYLVAIAVKLNYGTVWRIRQVSCEVAIVGIVEC